jgi:protein TonB
MRVVGAIFIAVLINAMLFTMMQSMVMPKRLGSNSRTDAQSIDFVRLDMLPKSESERKRTRPPPKPAPQKTQKAFEPMPSPADISHLPLAVPRVELDLPLEIGAGPYLGEGLAEIPSQAPDLILASELTPVVQIPPQYPHNAKRRHLEGYVDVEFTVDREGRVADPKIIAADPPNVFNRAVIQALRHWRFEPRLVDGLAVAVRAKQRIDFNLAGS